MAYWRVPMAYSPASVPHQYASAARQHRFGDNVASMARRRRGTSKVSLPHRETNQSRAHCSVCSIWYGKDFNVQTGIVGSGGSTEEPYDSDSPGRTTCVLPLVPLVPLSRSGSGS